MRQEYLTKPETIEVVAERHALDDGKGIVISYQSHVSFLGV
jgi:hypothetical protein